MRVLSALVNELAPYKRSQWEAVCLVYQKKKMQQDGIAFEAKGKHSHLSHLLVPSSLTSHPTQL